MVIVGIKMFMLFSFVLFSFESLNANMKKNEIKEPSYLNQTMVI